MTTDKKLVLLFLGVLICAGLVTFSRISESFDVELEPAVSDSADLDDPANAPRRASEAEAEAELRVEAGEEDPASAESGAVVDLEAADRDLDLFGRVTDKDGAPIAGAQLRCFENPWRRIATLHISDEPAKSYLATTISAADGSYAFRLRRGERVDLEVTAPGFGMAEIPSCLAGGRVDVVLEEAAALTVQCLTPDGEAAEGVGLRLWVDRDDVRAFHREGRTNAQGLCSFVDLGPGVATVTVEKSGHAPKAWTKVPLERGQISETTIRFDEARILCGRVTEALTGAAIANAEVAYGWTMRGCVTTDAQGYYRLPVTQRNTGQQVHVTAPGHGRAEAKIPEHGDLDFALTPADSVRGRLLDPEGGPVPDACIQIVGSEDTAAGQMIDSGGTRSDQAGSFKVADLRRDLPHSLIITKRGFGRYLLDFDPHPEVPGDIDLGTIILPRGRAIDGRILDAKQEPVARVELVLKGFNGDRARLRSEADEPLDFFYGQSERVRTDDLGRYRFNDLAPGTYVISHEVGSSMDRTRRVELGADADQTGIDFQIQGKKTLRLICLDPAGEGVANVSVTASADQYTKKIGTFRSDSAGRITIPHLEDAEYALHLRYDGDLSTPPDLSVRPDDEVLEIRLFKSAHVRGRVLPPAGTALGGHILYARFEDGGELKTRSKKDGRFSFEAKAGQQVTIEARGERLDPAEGYFDPSMEGALYGRMTVRAPAADLVLDLAPLATDRELSFRVVDADGHAVSGARVDCWEPNFHGVTDDAGLFHKEGLSARAVTVFASPPRGGAEPVLFRSKTVEAVPDGGTVTLSLRRAVLIRGSVVDEKDAPCPDLSVEFRGDDGDVNQVETDGRGQFEMAIPEATPGVIWASERGRRSPRRSRNQRVDSRSQTIKLVLD